MELGLSLGGESKPFDLLAEKNKVEKQRIKQGSLDFCMGLGLNNNSIFNGSQQEKDYEEISDDDNLQLNLVPCRQISSSLVPVHLQSLIPWSSDHNERTGLDVKRVPGEEVSSATANSMGCNCNFNKNKKREFENDVVQLGERRGSDDIDIDIDEGRKKLRLSKDESAFLEQTFKQHNTLNPKQKVALAKQLNLRPRQVEVWFQNRRARTKLKQTEVDCDYLKRCCETLSDENTRLHKELQELRVLKNTSTSSALPATTLTICPSCATTSTATPKTY
ncbi:hypothetical protein RD792_015565 [Penstemon davidsonii]|uniref:Homeobox domain-containing protein n=1 Tax=Penstemon davidsonii TaxID=160366 RepID=A0ABR0CIR7_9LAMI|nr:hypothetical protein RD792_015565 [Penstemon davidsonii]